MSHSNAGRILRVGALARVEGEGSLHLRIEDDRVVEAQLQIYEPPRFFEALLRGRDVREAPDITARICGICPVAYQMSACAAIEDVCGVVVPPDIGALRRLLYCGEWLASHALHVWMLHAPDFLGYNGAIEMARDHPALVQRALRLKHVGNTVLETIGGRAVHPVNVRVGGFYRAPAPDAVAALEPDLVWALQAALDTVDFVAGLDFPDHEGAWDLLALAGTDEYPMLGRRVRSARSATDIDVAHFGECVAEEQVPHSTALHARWSGGTYLVGPLARYAINRTLLPPLSAQAAAATLGTVCRNPFRSIIVRAVEMAAACELALDLVRGYRPPAQPWVAVQPRAGVGHGVTEAPRGLLYHRYEIADDGTIRSATIVPPTSQNQAAIEADLLVVATANLHRDDRVVTQRCERAIRNHDPCISCATHFLTVVRS